MDQRLEKACQYLMTKAYKDYKSIPNDKKGRCAMFVRMACDFGFETNVDHILAAKNYAPAYEKLGFKKIWSFPETLESQKNGYAPEYGDIAIIQYEPYGHICMYTKEGWISDFRQKDMYGGKIRDKNPSFTILRLC